ncbi:DUF4265 domain-containing protein [Dactylosporangium sp. CS-033363]|uniref:DUF4265 domain-containing protein n=1 Tax=Dactylosporangium sp. CS-033363 TaxID=3239935 RepID=UPI003D93803A
MTSIAPDVHVRPVGHEAKIRIWFKFVPREGWLPYDTEGLWATVVTEDTASVNNVPFLQDGVAEGDIVRFETDADGRHWALGRVVESGNCTIRVLPIPNGPLGRSAHGVHEKFARFGLGGEVFSAEFPLVALTVPAAAEIRDVKRLLEQGQADGWWHYEVGCGSQRWWDA